jgi:hypothetical protein
MMFSTNTALAAMLAVAPLARAHMIMAQPVPYGDPDKAPLLENGANFPCKSQPYTVNKMNDWPVGSLQNLTFTSVSTAAHAGGSCQISVTLDKEPTKASIWKVIHSFEGGCPIPPTEGTGNYVEGTDPHIPAVNFTIPSELPDGEMTMAWTWLNKVGNREMYMNCGPVKISGGSSDKAAFDALPDMAVANIAGQGNCKTTEGFDYLFPNPGKYVTKGGKGPFAPLCGGSPQGGAAPGAPGAPVNPGIPSPAPANPGAPSQAPANPGTPTPSPAAASPSAGGGKVTSTLRTLITVTAPSGQAPSSLASAQSPVAAKPTPPASQASAAPSQAPAASGVAPPAGQACSPDGSIVCSADGKQFAICNFGKASFQPVAAGTTCQGGKIAKRADYASTLRIVYA